MKASRNNCCALISLLGSFGASQPTLCFSSQHNFSPPKNMSPDLHPDQLQMGWKYTEVSRAFWTPVTLIYKAIYRGFLASIYSCWVTHVRVHPKIWWDDSTSPHLKKKPVGSPEKKHNPRRKVIFQSIIFPGLYLTSGVFLRDDDLVGRLSDFESWPLFFCGTL